MNRFFLEVAYDGIAFHGSQIQGSLPTVQLFIDKALSILLKQATNSFGASRTDGGVHALSSFYHFDTDKSLGEQFLYKLNCILPEHISVRTIYQCEGTLMNARFDAISRTYRYRIYTSKNPFKINRAHYYPFKINRALLDEMAREIMYHQHFESFSKRNTQSHTFLCKITESYWQETEDELHYVVTANRFLRGMVRGLVSTQLQHSRKGSLQSFIDIIQSNDCTNADFSVPGYGLYLEKIVYPEGTLKCIQSI